MVVSGLGFITSIGNSRSEVLTSLCQSRHGFASCDLAESKELPVKVIGPVREFDVSSTNSNAWVWPQEYDFDRQFVRGLPPHGLYAASALVQALREAGLSADDLIDGQTGMYCASGGSPMLLRHHLNRMAENQWQRGHPLGVVSSISGSLNFNLAAHFGIRGSTCGFVSACTSGSHALGFAFDEIALGRQRCMLVVAGEDINLESVLPFQCMNALSSNPDPATASRPFAVGRDGFVATGGGVALILENEEHARARGVQAQARMVAWSQASDGYHVAHPHPQGIGLRSAMERTMANGRVDRAEIDYVNAHATSTPTGDLAESLALREVFTAHKVNPLVSSTKALTGHALSLAGAMEAAFCVLALREGIVPGQPLASPIDPACSHLNIPHTTLAAGNPRVVLNNNSGFGGSNVCHLFAAS